MVKKEKKNKDEGAVTAEFFFDAPVAMWNEGKKDIRTI